MIVSIHPLNRVYIASRPVQKGNTILPPISCLVWQVVATKLTAIFSEVSDRAQLSHHCHLVSHWKSSSNQVSAGSITVLTYAHASWLQGQSLTRHASPTGVECMLYYFVVTHNKLLKILCIWFLSAIWAALSIMAGCIRRAQSSHSDNSWVTE